MNFKATLEKEWYKMAVKKGNLNMESREGVDETSSYFKKQFNQTKGLTPLVLHTKTKMSFDFFVLLWDV